jgi:hypothetical protein
MASPSKNVVTKKRKHIPYNEDDSAEDTEDEADVVLEEHKATTTSDDTVRRMIPRVVLDLMALPHMSQNQNITKQIAFHRTPEGALRLYCSASYSMMCHTTLVPELQKLFTGPGPHWYCLDSKSLEQIQKVLKDDYFTWQIQEESTIFGTAGRTTGSNKGYQPQVELEVSWLEPSLQLHEHLITQATPDMFEWIEIPLLRFVHSFKAFTGSGKPTQLYWSIGQAPGTLVLTNHRHGMPADGLKVSVTLPFTTTSTLNLSTWYTCMLWKDLHWLEKLGNQASAYENSTLRIGLYLTSSSETAATAAAVDTMAQASMLQVILDDTTYVSVFMPAHLDL